VFLIIRDKLGSFGLQRRQQFCEEIQFNEILENSDDKTKPKVLKNDIKQKFNHKKVSSNKILPKAIIDNNCTSFPKINETVIKNNPKIINFTEKSSPSSKPTSPKSNKNKRKNYLEIQQPVEFLNELEKDYFYSLLGLVNQQNKKQDRDFYIFSVEYLLESLFKSGKPILKNLGLNNQLKNIFLSAASLENLQKALILYNNCIMNKIIIDKTNYEKFVELSLK
jgi:hypothetical protein